MQNIGINGFGRIGKLITRILADDKDLTIVGINSHADAENFAYLLKYDTVYGILNKDVSFDPTSETIGDVKTSGSLLIEGFDIPCFQEEDISRLPWKTLDAEIIIEGTGEAKKRAQLEQHLYFREPPLRVLLTCPGKKKEDVDATIVLGVNDHIYDPSKHHLISNASCTTNCLAPMAKVLNDGFSIEYGFMATIHAVTLDQRGLDGSHMKDHRRGRAAGWNIVPTTTGAAKGIGIVIPELEGKLKGIALRVPVPDGSLVYLVTKLAKNPSKEDVNAAFVRAAQGQLSGYLHATTEKIVSSDIVQEPLNRYSAIVSLDQTDVIEGGLVQTVAWYDNEMAYARRVVDLVKRL